MLPQLTLIAAGTLASEDLACIAAGVLVAQGHLSFAAAASACFAGIFTGDLLLFLAGRWAGGRALRWKPLARWLPEDKVSRGASWIEERGLAVVLISRFTPGLRLPTYFAAGLLRIGLTRFALRLAIACALWTPLLVGATVLLGAATLQSALRLSGLGAFAVLAALVLAVRRLLRHPGRLRWEFWPVWLAYLPVVPYIAWLALRHRSLTLFTAANPGIETGGFAGESKSRILENLDGAAAFAVARHAGEALRFIDGYPAVLKPDVGERGAGVAIVRSRAEVVEYFERARGPVIVQRYVPGVEFGVFYYRFPGQRRGHISSITEKRFPVVTGDGRSTLRDLIHADPRARIMSSTYARLCKRPLTGTPGNGERVQLVEIGSHCRGAIFLDAGRLRTPQLEAAIDRIAQSHPGFYFGRFDLRAESIAAFQQGHFTVIELNGVTAEPTHIYDPSVSIRAAYRTLFHHWRVAFAIGAANRRRGFAPTPSLTLLRASLDSKSWTIMGRSETNDFPARDSRLRFHGTSEPPDPRILLELERAKQVRHHT